jgi:hypothetical protein
MSDPKTINYQPLLAMNGLWCATFKDTIKFWLPGLVVVCIVAALVAAPGLAFELATAITILYMAFVSSRVNKLKNNVWKEFAAANGWPLDTQNSPAVVIPPSLQFGHSRTWSPIIQAKLDDLACDLLTYQCATGSGRSEVTHNFTIASTSLAQALPHLLLMSKKVHADVQRDLVNGETLKLEGDFNDYFNLQIEKGQEVDVLTIITPDIMQTLVDHNQAEDIEILGQNLYFITNQDKRDYRDMQVLISSVVALSQQIVQNITLSASVEP